MKKFLFITTLLISAFSFAACGKEEPVEENFDVRFAVPESVVVNKEDNPVIQFRIQFGKAPAKTDVVCLESPSGKFTCNIKEITDSHFTVTVPETIIADKYTVYIQRGSKKVERGEIVISIEDSVKPADGSTVFGQVTCDGKGLADVLVSDGVEMVKTDAKGVFQMKSAKKYGYVFVVVPDGYEAPLSGVVPTFYRKLTTTTAAQRCDFALNKADNTNYTLYILGDMHLANRGFNGGSNKDVQQFKQFANDLNANLESHPGCEYVLTLGDMTWDMYWYEVALGKFDLQKYIELVNSLFKGVPFFHTMGNHDNDYKGIADFGKERQYREMVAPTYYSFNLGKIHYIVLDNVDYQNVGGGQSDESGVMMKVGGVDPRDGYKIRLSDDQLEWIKKDLSYVSKTTPVVVTSHGPFTKPVLTTGLTGTMFTNNMSNATEVLNLFNGYNLHIFTGHTHKTFNNDKMASNNYFEHNAGSVCGSWWWSGARTEGINLAQDGAPGGYTVLEVNGTNLKWQYKATGHDASYQFRAYDMNAVKEYVATVVPTASANPETFAALKAKINEFGKNEILLNIWNYDPSWTVSVTENGKDLKVTQFTSYDPLHIVAMSAKHGNFSTESWNHFFKVTASGTDTPVEITVTDRFGRTYSETMQRPKAFIITDYTNK